MEKIVNSRHHCHQKEPQDHVGNFGGAKAHTKMGSGGKHLVPDSKRDSCLWYCTVTGPWGMHEMEGRVKVARGSAPNRATAGGISLNLYFTQNIDRSVEYAHCESAHEIKKSERKLIL
jgi:hypothetical protein